MSKDNVCKKKTKSYNGWDLLLIHNMTNLYIKVAKMLNFPEDVVKKVLETKEQHPKQNYKYLASKISKEIDFVLQDEDVKEIVEKSKELLKWYSDKLEELNNDIKQDNKYETDWQNYIIYTTVNSSEGKRKERYTLPVELVDRIFNDYSRHWKNLSGQAIMTKYKLKPKVWNLIKSNIGLYKDSHILSPLSMDIADSEWKLEEIIEDATYNNFNDKYRHKYKEAHTINLEKTVKKQAKILGTIEGFLEQIQPYINTIKPLHIQALKHSNYKGAIPVYHFWDTHLWKVDTEKVIQRLEVLKKDIIATPSKIVYINCLWDIFETLVQGWMHSGQIESMNGVYGADLFMYGVNIFVNFLKDILKTGKKVHFIGIGGNHDRASTLNEWDNERIYATIFYEMLKAYLANANIQFQIIRDKVGMFEVDNIQYLTGHEGIQSKQPEKVAWKFADTGKQVVYVTAHVHNEQIYTGKNVTQLVINALAGENEYDKRLWLHSYPWYTKTERNEFGLPDIYSKRLP